MIYMYFSNISEFLVVASQNIFMFS